MIKGIGGIEMSLLLAIESSCDEMAMAVLKRSKRIFK